MHCIQCTSCRAPRVENVYCMLIHIVYHIFRAARSAKKHLKYFEYHFRNRNATRRVDFRIPKHPPPVELIYKPPNTPPTIIPTPTFIPKMILVTSLKQFWRCQQNTLVSGNSHSSLNGKCAKQQSVACAAFLHTNYKRTTETIFAHPSSSK